MEFIFLADRPNAIPTIARWYFDQWGYRTPGSSVDGVRNRIENALNRDKPPLFVLATEGEQILGVAELKIREMDIYPQLEYWLGGVFVPPEHRGKKIGSSVARKVATLAQSFDIGKLYLQTERLDGGLYARLGWKPLEQVNYKGLEVLVMEKQLGV